MKALLKMWRKRREERQLNRNMRQEWRKMYPNGLPPFKPGITYDPRMDMIQVILRDCSVTEVDGILNVLTLLKINRPKRGENPYIGFHFSPAKQFATNNNLIDGNGRVDLHRILDSLALQAREEIHKDAIWTARQALYRLYPNTTVLLT